MDSDKPLREPSILETLCDGLPPIIENRIRQAYWRGVADGMELAPALAESRQPGGIDPATYGR